MTNNLKVERTLTAESKMSDADWLDEAARYFEKRPTGGEDMAFWANVTNAERCRSIAKSLRSQSLSTQQPMGEVRVKALKWVEYPNSLAPDYFGHAWEAETPFGRYVVEETSGSDSPVYETNFRYERLIAATDGLPEAKDAAESDYQKRILSALHPNQESGE